MGNPRFEGTHTSSTTDMTSVAPFAGVTLSDPGVTDPSERITIRFQGQGGTLSDGPGYTGPKTLQGAYVPDDPYDSGYSLEGPLAQVMQELDALSFVPRPGRVGTTTSTALLLNDLSSSGSINGYSPDSGTVVNNTTTSAELSIASQVAYARGVFTLTGHASTAAGITSVEISAEVDGVATDLGAATVDANGVATFADRIGPHTQGFITATATSGAGAGAADTTPFSFTGGLNGTYKAEQDSYTAEGNPAATNRFKANGSQLVSVQAPGQTFSSSFFDTFENGGNPESTFVFNPYFGSDRITGFRVNGADHDMLSFARSDFGNSVAAVLQNTQQQKGGAVIVDPVTGDSVKLFGVSKQQLAANRQDFTFHA